MEYRFVESLSYTGDDLRRIRMEKEMTQKEMAEYLGVSKKAVEAWEYGENPPSGPVKRLLEILQLGDLNSLPFAVERIDPDIRFLANAAKHSRGSAKHWMRYLDKVIKGEGIKLTEKQIEKAMKSEKLDLFQKVSLARAVESGTPTNRYVIGLGEKIRPMMLEEVMKNAEKRRESLSDVK